MSFGPEMRRSVAIFGALSDIAAQVARQYAEAGDRLILIGRAPEPLAAMAADLTVRGASQVAIQTADFADLSSLPTVATKAWQEFGGLDVALISYGQLPDQDASERDLDTAAAALTINFNSPVLLIGELARGFRAQQHGTIAAISSVAGDRGRKSNYIYGASKGGLQRYLEGLRHSLHASKVHVLDIRPGFVATKMTAHLGGGGLLWATPEKVADDIVKAVARQRAVSYTPWFWRFILMVIRALPRAMIHRTSL